jgi:hypothetical protein
MSAQQIDEPTAAAASDIQSRAAILRELDCFFELCKAI